MDHEFHQITLRMACGVTIKVSKCVGGTFGWQVPSRRRGQLESQGGVGVCHGTVEGQGRW